MSKNTCAGSNTYKAFCSLRPIFYVVTGRMGPWHRLILCTPPVVNPPPPPKSTSSHKLPETRDALDQTVAFVPAGGRGDAPVRCAADGAQGVRRRQILSARG